MYTLVWSCRLLFLSEVDGECGKLLIQPLSTTLARVSSHGSTCCLPFSLINVFTFSQNLARWLRVVPFLLTLMFLDTSKTRVSGSSGLTAQLHQFKPLLQHFSSTIWPDRAYSDCLSGEKFSSVLWWRSLPVRSIAESVERDNPASVWELN